MGGEEAALGAGEVVLGKSSDGLKEERSGFVIEEPGRESLGVRGEAEAGLGVDGFVGSRELRRDR